MFVCDVLNGQYLNFYRLFLGKLDIAHKPDKARDNQKQQGYEIESVEHIEREIVVYNLHDELYKHQKIHRDKSTYI